MVQVRVACKIHRIPSAGQSPHESAIKPSPATIQLVPAWPGARQKLTFVSLQQIYVPSHLAAKARVIGFLQTMPAVIKNLKLNSGPSRQFLPQRAEVLDGVGKKGCDFHIFIALAKNTRVKTPEPGLPVSIMFHAISGI